MTKEVLPGNCRGVRRRYNAFTVIELIVVVGVIIILTGLVLSTVGYARKKGARARAETEIAAMAAACESYKADNGIYPRNCDTDALDTKTLGNPTTYQNASLYLYNALFGAINGGRTPASGARSYFVFKPNMLFPADQTQNVQYIQDPFGNSYGYSSRYANFTDWQNYDACSSNGCPPCCPPSCPRPTSPGYNPTFDLWSTAGLTANPGSPDTITPQWIKNW
jgi:type II secretory pathway pseudopilin PulG